MATTQTFANMINQKIRKPSKPKGSPVSGWSGCKNMKGK